MKSKVRSDAFFTSENWHSIYAKLLEHTHDAVLVRELDGTVVYWNRGAEALYGYTSAEALGRISHELLKISPAEGVQASARAGWWDGELVHVTKDGRALAVASRQAVVEEGGRAFVLETNRDITDRKLAEHALRERERELEALVENSPDIIFRLDTKLRHRFISGSVQQVSGRAPAEFIGKTGREMGIPSEACDVFEATCRDVMETRQQRQVEFSVSGSFYHSRLIPEFAPDGSVSSVMGVTYDITERKRTEEALCARARSGSVWPPRRSTASFTTSTS